MAFKKFSDFVEEKNGLFFTLPNNGDSAEVIFLYQSVDDVLVADVHWISSSAFKGYAHCLGDRNSCPACAYRTQKGYGIRKDTTIFIPLYNIDKKRVEFWQRSYRFENVLQQSVFKNYPNPSEFVFKITRNGEAGDPATRYSIVPSARNSSYPYAQILTDFQMTMPESYDLICKELTFEQMDGYLKSDTPSDLPDYSYTPMPRGTSEASTEVPANDFASVPTPEYSAPPVDVPTGDFGAAPNANDLPAFDPTSTSGSSSGKDGGATGNDDIIDNVDF